MPFVEFISSGDLKFIIPFLILTGIAVTHFIKKLRTKNAGNPEAVSHRNSKISMSASWILTLSALSLLLGLMHSFYMIGHAGGIAPNILFGGLSYTLITPVFGLGLYMICQLLKGIANQTAVKS